MAVVQNSLSGIWPTLAKKRNPFASSFAKLSRSPFSHVGHLGYQLGYQQLRDLIEFLGLHMGVIQNYCITE